jgi:transcription initiation factor IIE alpha subunit
MTRTRLVIEIVKLMLDKYPIKWTSSEISIALGVNRRTVDRVLSEMMQSKLTEKRYASYTLNTMFINQLYGARWFVGQQTKKDILIEKVKNGRK